MKPQLLFATLALGTTMAVAAPKLSNLTAKHPQKVHFAKGTTQLIIKAHLHDAQHRFYAFKVREGQQLVIEAQTTAKNPDKAIVPLIFVTPPGGKYDGDKISEYSEYSSKAGIYRVEVAANLMASNANSGTFTLRVSAK